MKIRYNTFQENTRHFGDDFQDEMKRDMKDLITTMTKELHTNLTPILVLKVLHISKNFKLWNFLTEYLLPSDALDPADTFDFLSDCENWINEGMPIEGEDEEGSEEESEVESVQENDEEEEEEESSSD
jgi:hypothetical protein